MPRSCEPVHRWHICPPPCRATRASQRQGRSCPNLPSTAQALRRLKGMWHPDARGSAGAQPRMVQQIPSFQAAPGHYLGHDAVIAEAGFLCGFSHGALALGGTSSRNPKCEEEPPSSYAKQAAPISCRQNSVWVPRRPLVWGSTQLQAADPCGLKSRLFSSLAVLALLAMSQLSEPKGPCL